MSETDTGNSNLNVARRRAIAALLEMRSYEDAAAEAGVAVRTLYRWRSDPVFVAALRAAQGDDLHELSRQFHAEARQSLAVMVAIRDDATAAKSVQLRAAALIVEHAQALRGATDFEARIAALEERLL